MSDRERLTAWHLAQVGVREQGRNNVPYNTHYYGREVDGEEYPWCAAYIWDGFQQCGLSRLFLNGGKSAYCPYIAGWARRNEQWVTEDYQEGDILFFDWDGDGMADHVGYCVQGGGSVRSVEGNVGDCVELLTRPLSEVMGAYRPHYGAETAAGGAYIPAMGETGVTGKALPELGEGERGTAVRIAQRLLLQLGYRLPLYGADGDFGAETAAAVRQYQKDMGLDADGIVGERTWGALGGERHGTDRV